MQSFQLCSLAAKKNIVRKVTIMLNKLKLGPKLIGGFMIVALFTLTIGVLGINNIGKINKLIGTLYNNHLLGISHVKEANLNMVYIGREVRNMILASTTTDRENYEKRLKSYNEVLKEELREAKKSTFNDEGKMIIQKVETAFEEYFKYLNDLISTIKNQELMKVDKTVMDKLVGARKAGDEADDAMTELANYKESRGEKMYNESDKIYKDMRNLLIVCVIIATLIGIAIGIFLTLSITRPVNRIVQTAKKIAEEELVNLSDALVAGSNGDLSNSVEIKTEEMAINSEDEIGILGQAFNKMVAKLQVSGKALAQLKKSLEMVSDETIMLATEALEGHLTVRGDIKKFNGTYKDMVDGFNKTLDAIVEPIKETNNVLQKVAEHDLTVRVKGDYCNTTECGEQ